MCSGRTVARLVELSSLPPRSARVGKWSAVVPAEIDAEPRFPARAAGVVEPRDCLPVVSGWRKRILN